MATQLPASRCQSTPPLAGSPSGPTVPGDETVTPFGPVAETIGRPYIRPHRLAQAMRDDDAAYNRLRAGQRDYARVEQWQREADAAADELAAQIGDVVIAIGLGVMFVCAFVMWFA